MQEVKVRGVGIDPKTMSTVLLLSSGDKVLPIFIGVAEATSIASELEGTKSQRPQTHDLMIEVLEKLKSRIEKVIITDFKDNTYYAVMTIIQDGYEDGASVKLEIDARPSDAVALALKSKAPIYLSEKLIGELVLMEVDVEIISNTTKASDKEPIAKGEVEAFKQFLADVTPEEWQRFIDK
ncbi:MAG: bifunctional nuclease family protein [Firmicutes bacterium]|nr:bifunctional nuclease family protein [Bacillota bacterium]MDD4264788.1 bifunctional nuclease family protein [Bacillota bacterium]MDD4694480.1 bifunctional nuclease family protein [Bacillota bacterium]